MSSVDRGEARKYVALIGDFRRSRQSTGRAELQRLPEDALSAANDRFERDLAARLVLTLGDEFQGLLLSPRRVVDVIIALDGALAGADVRYGIGWGELPTEFRDVALSVDGPCFHLARRALAAGKRSDRWVTASGFGRDDEPLNGLFWLIGAVRWQWTDIQRQTVELTRTAVTQKEVAEARGVSVPAVSKALKSALYEPVLAAERAVSEILARHDEPGSGKSDSPEVRG